MINPQWLELPMSRTNFHGPKDVRAIEVRLFMVNFSFWLENVYHSRVLQFLLAKSKLNLNCFTVLLSIRRCFTRNVLFRISTVYVWNSTHFTKKKKKKKKNFKNYLTNSRKGTDQTISAQFNHTFPFSSTHFIISYVSVSGQQRASLE